MTPGANNGGGMRRTAVAAAITVIVLVTAMSIEAQETNLFDQFNFKFEASFVKLNTTVRIDSSTAGKGTTLSFEDHLGLGDQEAVPSAAFEWQFGRKHRLALRWQEIDRKSSQQVLEEIQIGDEIIEIDTELGLAFDVGTWALDYTYYPWIRDRWAAGFGFGLRILEIKTVFTADELEVEADGTFTAPLPYFNFEYRRTFGDRWRIKAGLGWLAVEIQDIKGGQWIGRLALEHHTFTNVGFGIALNYSTIDIQAAGDEFRGMVDLDINDLSVFTRVNF